MSGVVDLLIRFLAASAQRGSTLLAVGIFGGLLVPPLAHAMRWFIAPNVVCMMTLVLLRVDVAATVAHLRRPGRLVAIVAFQLLVCPFIAWAAAAPGWLDAGIAAAMVIYATGCGATSGAAFARLVGLDPDLSLIATLATTLLVPLTAPPLAYALTGVDLAITMGGFMARLVLVVGLPLCISMTLRWLAGAERLRPLGPAVDGALVWLVVFYGFAVMDGLVPRLVADPAWVAQAAIVAFAIDFGLNALTTFAFLGLGRRTAASAGLMSGNRNMALYLAVLPAAADPRIALFFSICQIPLFLSPFLLRGVYRGLLRKPSTRMAAG
jgi:BASS family bile acid:Na+ symporter